jgi:hypothetical protein
MAFGQSIWDFLVYVVLFEKMMLRILFTFLMCFFVQNVVLCKTER